MSTNPNTVSAVITMEQHTFSHKTTQRMNASRFQPTQWFQDPAYANRTVGVTFWSCKIRPRTKTDRTNAAVGWRAKFSLRHENVAARFPPTSENHGCLSTNCEQNQEAPIQGRKRNDWCLILGINLWLEGILPTKFTVHGFMNLNYSVKVVVGLPIG